MTSPCSLTMFHSFADLTISDAATAYHMLQVHWEENRLDCVQNFAMLLIDERCRAVGWADIPVEMVTANKADTRQIVAIAARENAYGFVLAQNEPHGVITPQARDIAFIGALDRAAGEAAAGLSFCQPDRLLLICRG